MPSCSAHELLGSSADFLDDPHLVILIVTVGYSLFENSLWVLLVILDVEDNNRLNKEWLDIAV